MDYHLVGGFNHFLFSIIYRIVLPIDFHIFQRGRCTTNQSWITCVLKSLPTIVGVYIHIYISLSPSVGVVWGPCNSLDVVACLSPQVCPLDFEPT